MGGQVSQEGGRGQSGVFTRLVQLSRRFARCRRALRRSVGQPLHSLLDKLAVVDFPLGLVAEGQLLDVAGGGVDERQQRAGVIW